MDEVRLRTPAVAYRGGITMHMHSLSLLVLISTGAFVVPGSTAHAAPFDLVGARGVNAGPAAAPAAAGYSERLKAIVDAQRARQAQIIAGNAAAQSVAPPAPAGADAEERDAAERMLRQAKMTPPAQTFEATAARRHYTSAAGMTASPAMVDSVASNGSPAWSLVASTIANPDGTPRAMGAIKALRYAYDNVDERTTVYAGALNGGLWKQRLLFLFPFWDLISGNLAGSPSVGAFWVDPDDSHVLLIGTGAYGRADGTGLYRSLDAGDSWTHIQMGGAAAKQPADFLHLENDQFTPQTLYACTDIGFWVSKDQGGTWTLRRPNACSDFIQLDFFGATLLVVADYGGAGAIVYGSGDGTWTAADSTGIGAPRGRISLTQDVATGVVFALATKPSSVPGTEDFLGIYRSTNFGLSDWTNIGGSLNLGSIMGFHANAIRVDPEDSNVLAVGMVKMALTTNANAAAPTWTVVSTGLSDHTDFQFVPQALQPGNTKVVIANDGGIYVYDWTAKTVNYDENNRGMNVELVMGNTDSMTHSRRNVNLIGAGLWDTGDVLVDFGSSSVDDRITRLVSSGDGGAIALSPDSDQDMVATIGASWYRYLSSDRGTTWTRMDDGCANVDASMTAPWALTLDQTPGYGDDAYTFSRTGNPGSTVYGIYQTSTNAASCSWTKMHNGNLPALYDRSGIDVSVSVANNIVINIIYVAAADRSAATVLSGNVPMTIADRTPPAVTLSTSRATSFTADRYPQQPKTAYYTWCSGNAIYLGLTEDAGLTWQNATGNIGALLPGGTPRELVADPLNLDHLFLATDTGVYRSFNRGVTWIDYSEGLPVSAAVTQLEFDALSNPRRLLLGSYGFGFYARNVESADTIFDGGFD